MTRTLSEEAIRAAVVEVAEAEILYYSHLEMPKHHFSLDFERRMRILIKRAFGMSGQVRFTYLHRRAVAVAVAIVLALAAPMSVSAVRTAVFNLVEEIYEKFTHYFFQSDDPQQESVGLFVEHVPTYIPEGYQLVNKSRVDQIFLEYRCNLDIITFYQLRISDFSMNFNTEGIEVEQMAFRGCEAQYFSSAGLQYLFWYDDEYSYVIVSSLDRETVFRIAESVK